MSLQLLPSILEILFLNSVFRFCTEDERECISHTSGQTDRQKLTLRYDLFTVLSTDYFDILQMFRYNENVQFTYIALVSEFSYTVLLFCRKCILMYKIMIFWRNHLRHFLKTGSPYSWARMAKSQSNLGSLFRFLFDSSSFLKWICKSVKSLLKSKIRRSYGPPFYCRHSLQLCHI